MASCKEPIGVGSIACWFLFVFAFPIKTREVVPKHEAGGTRNNNFFVCLFFYMASLLFFPSSCSFFSTQQPLSCFAWTETWPRLKNLSLLLCLSPPQRPFCVVGRLGRKRKKAPETRWEGERAFYFSIIAIFIGIPSGSLYGGESCPVADGFVSAGSFVLQLQAVGLAT